MQSSERRSPSGSARRWSISTSSSSASKPFFVSTYRTLAEWRAVVARLDGFETAIKSAAAEAISTSSIGVHSSTGSDNIHLEKLLVNLPNGTPLVSADRLSILGNQRTLVI